MRETARLGACALGIRGCKSARCVARYRAIFLSDIHLGTKGCQADRLLDFLKQHGCDRLYLVGDIIDGWRMKSNFYWPQAHNNVLRRFLTLMKRGTALIEGADGNFFILDWSVQDPKSAGVVELEPRRASA